MIEKDRHGGIDMLHIKFDTDSDRVIIDVKGQFRAGFKPEWLESDLAKRMVLDVDKSKVIAPYCIESPVLGQISPFMLSGGVQNLLMMLNFPEDLNIEFWGQACGENCEKWIYEIAKTKNIVLRLSNMMTFDSVGKFDVPVMVHLRSGETVEVHNSLELMKIEIFHADDFDSVDYWEVLKQREAEHKKEYEERVKREEAERLQKQLEDPIFRAMWTKHQEDMNNDR